MKLKKTSVQFSPTENPYMPNECPPATIEKRGSTYYSGRGYRLVMYRDYFEAGGTFFGYYGPVLHFESRTGVAGPGQLSQVRVVRLPLVR